MRLRRLGLMTVVVLMLCASPLYAAETEAIPNHKLLSEELMFTVGVFFPRTATSAELKPSGGGSGVVIDFEETLNLDDRSTVPTLGGFWRVTDNWRVRFDYFELNRDATRTLLSDVDWGDQTFLAGDTVNSTLNFSDLRLSAAYSFFKRRDKELGVGIGLHIANIETSLQSGASNAENADITAPLPVLNFYGMFALTDEWALDIHADWLSLSSGDFSGDILDISVNALYQPFENIGFGLGVRSLVIDVEIEDASWNGQARLSFHGPTAFMTVSF